MPINFESVKTHIPNSPGVYFFRDAEGKILYIGKAGNLKERLRSYFMVSANHTPAKIQMLEVAESLSWQEVESEIGALVLEAYLIKKHLPKYNILMRDDKNYFFVGFSKEKFPRVTLTHQPKAFLEELARSPAPNGAGEYIGPFTDGTSIKRVLKALRHVFPYCTCKELHKRPCQNAEIGLCATFCCLDLQKAPPALQDSYTKDEITRTAQEYKKNIHKIKKVLMGKQQNLARALKKDMEAASERSHFEQAAKLRDQFLGLERIFAHSPFIKKDRSFENQKALNELMKLLNLTEFPERIEGYDISNIQGNYAVGSMVVFTDGISDKAEYRKFKIKTVEGANDPAMMREILTRRFNNTWKLPNVILIDGGPTQLHSAIDAYHAAVSYQARAHQSELKIVSLAKREEKLYIPGKFAPIPLKQLSPSLLHLLQQVRNESHRFAISYYRKLHRAAQH
jgi:excinuclease ABC subunit C